MISGSAPLCRERTWMKWMSTPSISVLNCGNAFSLTSNLRQSYLVVQNRASAWAVASCTPCDRSATSSMEGQRVAATRRRSAASCSPGTLTRKGWIPVGLANPSRRRGAAPAGASATTLAAPTARPAATPRRSNCRRVSPDASINAGSEPSVLDDRVEAERMALPLFMIRRAWYRHEHARLVRASRPWNPWPLDWSAALFPSRGRHGYLPAQVQAHHNQQLCPGSGTA